MGRNTTISIRRESSEILDRISQRTGMSKSQLVSTLVERFFDSHNNPKVDEILNTFEKEKKSFEMGFVNQLVKMNGRENVGESTHDDPPED